MTDKPAKAQLEALLKQVFADGVLDEGEREQLKVLYRQGGLTVDEVKQIVSAFVERTWGETIADGIVTEEERDRLKTIVTELRLPPQMIPDAVAKAINSQPG